MRARLINIGLALVVATMLGCSSSLKGNLSETAGQFFSAIGRNDYAHAHRYLAETLARRTPVEGLTQFVRHTGLSAPGDQVWEDANGNDERAYLIGEIAVAGEPLPVPLRMSFEKEGTLWKIAGLERGIRVKSTGDEITIFAPSEDEGMALARQTTGAFARAVEQDNLKGFWADTADAFKQRYSAEDFSRAFAGFVNDKTNLEPASRITPVLDRPPTVRKDGELVLKGTFPTQPARVVFEYRYVLQNDAWKPSGIILSLQPAG